MYDMDIPEEEHPMNKKQTLKPVAATIGAALVTSLAAIPAAHAADNPFAANELSRGYMVAMEDHAAGAMPGTANADDHGAMKAAEDGKGMDDPHGRMQPAAKAKEGKCGEAKCGGNMGK